ncbi:MAG: acyltransferase family protein [Bacteroidota bacterium]
METKKQNQKERQYDIDWLRILLILSVFLFHIGMIFNTWWWHVKNDIQVEELRGVMVFLHYWRLPLLFLVSGVGTWLAMGRRTSGQYLKERFRRLFIPFLAGIFILVPVQVYIEKSTQFGSLLDFYPHMFDGIYPEGNFSWHHLWFILYLFVIALIISPFLKRMKRDRFIQFRERFISFVSRPLAMNVILVPLFLTQWILRPVFPEETHALFNDWAFFSFDLVFFLTGLILVSNTKLRDTIMKQRRFYLMETILTTLFMFSTPHLFGSEAAVRIAWDIASIFVAWSCSMAAIGYTRRYFNKDSKFRKLANEAIYPFYLLHQPVIIVVGYYVVEWPIPVLMKSLIITGLSLIIVVSVYWFIIRPVNFLRIIFGLKRVQKIQHRVEDLHQPITVSSAIDR